MEDFKWFLGFLVVMVMVWFGGRGALKPSSTPSPVQIATSSAQTVPTPGVTTPSEVPKKSTVSSPQTVVQEPLDPNASPLAGRLKIVSYSRGTTPEREYVLIQAPKTNSGPVLITGLVLGSASSLKKQVLPRGFPLPYPGAISEGELVSLYPGERAYIVSGRSPITLTPSPGNSTSFQLNKCTGFLGQKISFTPALPRQCPAPSSEPLPTNGYELSYECIQYLKRIPSCTVPGPIPPNLANDSTCDAYISTKINYTQCVVNHKNDADFYKGEWRMYLGRSTSLWQSTRETIELRDERGKLIDFRSY